MKENLLEVGRYVKVKMRGKYRDTDEALGKKRPPGEAVMKGDLFLGTIGVGEARVGERAVLRRESSQKERECMGVSSRTSESPKNRCKVRL
jgi:hypothetical protein